MKTISITARIGNGPDEDRARSRKYNRRVGWICPNWRYMERTVPSFHLIEF